MIILYGQKSLSSILISTDACIRSSILCSSTSINIFCLLAAIEPNNDYDNNDLDNHHSHDIEYTQILFFKIGLHQVKKYHSKPNTEFRSVCNQL